MQQSKIDIITNEAPLAAEQPSGLSKIFKALADRLPLSKQDPEPTINGSNYFTGEVSPEMRDRIGQQSAHAQPREEWKWMWKAIGVDPPGELPKGAVFHLMVESDKDGHSDVAVRSVTKSNGKMLTQWEINHTPAAKGEARRVSFAAVILPKLRKGEIQESVYKYNEPKKPRQPPQTPKV